MSQVIHTVNVRYGSYSEDGIKVVCDENDELDTVKAKVRRQLDLNFLSMATYSVRIVDTEYLD